MNQPTVSDSDLSDPGQRNAALFAGLVLQNVNMALMFLGRLPGPEGKVVPQDLNAAGVFVDTLEMLEDKTRGNLNKEEADFLKQSLMSARLAFAQAVQEPKPAAPAGEGEHPPSAPQAAPQPEAKTAESSDEKVRFTKKY